MRAGGCAHAFYLHERERVPPRAPTVVAAHCALSHPCAPPPELVAPLCPSCSPCIACCLARPRPCAHARLYPAPPQEVERPGIPMSPAARLALCSTVASRDQRSRALLPLCLTQPGAPARDNQVAARRTSHEHTVAPSCAADFDHHDTFPSQLIVILFLFPHFLKPLARRIMASTAMFLEFLQFSSLSQIDPCNIAPSIVLDPF